MTNLTDALDSVLIHDRHRFLSFSSQEAAIGYLNADLVQKITKSQQDGQRFIMTGAGGGTPKPLYAALAQELVEWSKVSFVILDERFVPLADERSNEGMILKFFAPTPAHRVQLLGLVPELSYSEKAAQLAEEKLALAKVDCLDFALLGMGGDGHYASLFPGHPINLTAYETQKRVLAVKATGTDKEPVIDRITLSASFILSCKDIAPYIAGAAKKEAFFAFCDEKDPMISPIGALLARATHPVRIVWAP